MHLDEVTGGKVDVDDGLVSFQDAATDSMIPIALDESAQAEHQQNEYDKWVRRACSTKVPHDTKESAIVGAQYYLDTREDFFDLPYAIVYECPICQKMHITKAMRQVGKGEIQYVWRTKHEEIRDLLAKLIATPFPDDAKLAAQLYAYTRVEIKTIYDRLPPKSARKGLLSHILTWLDDTLKRVQAGERPPFGLELAFHLVRSPHQKFFGHFLAPSSRMYLELLSRSPVVHGNALSVIDGEPEYVVMQPNASMFTAPEDAKWEARWKSNHLVQKLFDELEEIPQAHHKTFLLEIQNAFMEAKRYAQFEDIGLAFGNAAYQISLQTAKLNEMYGKAYLDILFNVNVRYPVLFAYLCKRYGKHYFPDNAYREQLSKIAWLDDMAKQNSAIYQYATKTMEPVMLEELDNFIRMQMIETRMYETMLRPFIEKVKRDIRRLY